MSFSGAYRSPKPPPKVKIGTEDFQNYKLKIWKLLLQSHRNGQTQQFTPLNFVARLANPLAIKLIGFGSIDYRPS